jgi:hypothetical protein
MAEGDLLMSGSERDRGHVVRQVPEHRLGQREASERLGIGIRQLKRLVRPWQRQGDAGLVSRQRGRASHNRLPEALRTQVMALLWDKYPDFGPTLAAEKLLAVDGSRSRARPSARAGGDGSVEAEELSGKAGVSVARPASAIWRTAPRLTSYRSWTVCSAPRRRRRDGRWSATTSTPTCPKASPASLLTSAASTKISERRGNPHPPVHGDTRSVPARFRSPDHLPLHAETCLLDQPDRDLVFDLGPQASPARQLHLQGASPAED